MKILTVENIALACNGKLVNADNFKDKEIEGAAIDSRKVEKDFLFFAYKGEKVDGHDYIKAAFDNGAACVVCEHVPEGEEGVCIEVENTIEALKKIAAFYREKLGIKVVGVTGSIGKTTTKEFIATVLSQKYNVFRTDKNQNNLIGLPLSILNIKENNEVAVLEMGISEFGEMTTLSEIAKPDICVITNISECHLETLGSLDGVFKAKTEIFEHMNPEGYVCVCGDDERLSKIEDVKGKKPVTFGFEESNEVHPTKIVNRGLWGSECTVENGEGMFSISVPLAGRHMIMDALAAVSVARIMELSAEQVSFGISCVKALQGRNNLIQKNSITIIDDCYNASPESMKSALDLLTEAVTPTVAILGDMYEQGANEDKSHEEVGEYAASKGINTIACVGPLSKKMYDKASVAASVKENTEVLYFASVEEAIENLATFVKKDDTVLIKASNGMKFNRILEALTSDENANKFEKREEKLFSQKVVETKDEDLIGEIKDVKADTPNTAAEAPKAVKEKTPDQKEKESAAKQVGIIIGAVALVIIIGLIVFGVIRHNQYKDATEGEILLASSQSYYTKGILGDNEIAPGSDNITWNWNINKFAPFSTDGKNIYYITYRDYIYELHACDKNGKDNVVVSEDVSKYEIIEKNKIIFESARNLYLYDTKKAETSLLVENISDYSLNKKKNQMVYLTGEGKLCKLSLDAVESAEVLDDGVNKLEYADEKLNDLVYSKSDGLYMKVKNKESVHVASDARDIYVTSEAKKLSLYYFDYDNALWYYKKGGKQADKICDICTAIYGKESGLDALILVKNDGSWNLLQGKNILRFKDFTMPAAPSYEGTDAKSKKIYFTGNDDATGKRVLYSVTYKGLPLSKKVTTESTNVDTVERIGEGKVFTLKNDQESGKDLYCDDKLVARNVTPGSLMKTEYGNDYLFTYQVSDSDGFYKIVLYDGKSIKEIGSSIDLDIAALSKKKIYYKSKGDVMFTVKYYNGKKEKAYAEGVNTFRFLGY